MMYKHSLNIVPKYISMMFQKNNEIHKHNTRKCNSLHSSVGKLETTYKSFSFHAINIWNYMLRHVPIHISYESFKRLTKVHIQENNINYRMVYWLVLHIFKVDLSCLKKVFLQFIYRYSMYHAFVLLFIFCSSKDKTDNYTNIIYNHVVLLRGIFIMLFWTINIYSYITIELTVCVLI